MTLTAPDAGMCKRPTCSSCSGVLQRHRRYQTLDPQPCTCLDMMMPCTCPTYACLHTGMHHGTQLGAPAVTVVGALEVHNIANDVYEHNFGWRPTQVLLLSAACLPTTCLSAAELI